MTTLDPTDWDAFATLAHRMVDDMLGHLRTVRDRPAWQPMPPDVRASFHEPVPWEGEGAEQAYEDFVRTVLPYPNGNLHPRFWGWVHGGGTPLGMMADMLAAGLNPHLAGFNQAPALVEHEVIRWLAELMGMPADASGVLVSGATMADSVSFDLPARGVAAGGFPFAERGMDLTRNFKALKVWMSMKAHGVHTYANLIEQNVADAQYLAALASTDPDLELLAPAPLNVVCFRYAPADVAPEHLDALNAEILIRVQEEGIAVPSGTRLRGRYAIRVANVNHRSRREDFGILADAVKRIGREIVASGRPATGVPSPETPRTEPGRA